MTYRLYSYFCALLLSTTNKNSFLIDNGYSLSIYLTHNNSAIIAAARFAPSDSTGFEILGLLSSWIIA